MCETVRLERCLFQICVRAIPSDSKFPRVRPQAFLRFCRFRSLFDFLPCGQVFRESPISGVSFVKMERYSIRGELHRVQLSIHRDVADSSARDPELATRPMVVLCRYLFQCNRTMAPIQRLEASRCSGLHATSSFVRGPQTLNLPRRQTACIISSMVDACDTERNDRLLSNRCSPTSHPE